MNKIHKHYGRPRILRRMICLFKRHVVDESSSTCACLRCLRCKTQVEACILHGWRSE